MRTPLIEAECIIRPAPPEREAALRYQWYFTTERGRAGVGHRFAMLFSAQMLVVTKEGAAYRQADYRSWLKSAGFASSEIVATPTPTPATLVLAK